jgi:glycosyltransferase involved in cell wall biosynthesis
MKIVFQNPQMTGDSMASGTSFPGINDYGVEFLRKYRPAVRIWPLKRFYRWWQFLRAKALPLTGWDYVFSMSELNKYDVLLSLHGNAAMLHDPIPAGFRGMKIHHVMDYSFVPTEAAAILRERKVDYLLGYSAHDRWCSFFQEKFPEYSGRIAPIPFGYSKRFRCETPWAERVAKCAVMGAVNPVRDPQSNLSTIGDYMEHFRDHQWAHPIRAAIRENLASLEDVVANFTAAPPAFRNISYDSFAELNRHKLFVNDDSIMHYPPARTYEATACGTVMICSDHPVYSECGWKDGVNCITHRFGDLDAFAATARRAVADEGRLAEIQRASLANASRFTHSIVADGLHEILRLLHAGKTEEARHYWSQ